MSTPVRRSNEVTPAHHAALIFIVCAGALLLGYFLVQKRLAPELKSARSNVESARREIAETRRFVASTDSPDIDDLHQKISEKEALVRTFAFQQEGDGGLPFVNATDRQNVERLMAQLLGVARGQQLTVRANEPKRGQEIDPRFARLVTRQLKLEGTFQQLYGFLSRLRALPHRVLVLDLQVKEVAEMPGLLDINLVLSV
jgi:hypothetical protein